MSIADRPRAEIMDRLRLTESLLVIASKRAEEAECKLAEFKVVLAKLRGRRRLCEQHKPLRSPICSLCQINARIEELDQIAQGGSE